MLSDPQHRTPLNFELVSPSPARRTVSIERPFVNHNGQLVLLPRGVQEDPHFGVMLAATGLPKLMDLSKTSPRVC